MINFNTQQFRKHNVQTNRLQRPLLKDSVWSPRNYKKSSMSRVLQYTEAPEIIINKLQSGQFFVPKIEDINSSSPEIPSTNFLSVQPTNEEADLELPSIKDNANGPHKSAMIVQKILENGQNSLSYFHGFVTHQALVQNCMVSHSPLRALQYFLMDLLFEEKLLMFREIQSFVEFNSLTKKPNQHTLSSLEKSGVALPYTDTQIKKLFFQYVLNRTAGESTLKQLQSYEVLFPVIEIVIVNFLSGKLSEDQFEDFNVQYQEQKIVPLSLYEILTKVFELEQETLGDNTEIKFVNRKLVIQQVSQSFKAWIE